MTPSTRKRKIETGVQREIDSKGKSKPKKKNKVTQLQSVKKKRMKKYTERNYTNDKLQEAIKGVQEGKFVREAAQKFGIPKSTLHLKLSNPSQIDSKKKDCKEKKSFCYYQGSQAMV